MEQVLILLVMLSGLTHAFWPPADTSCDATHNTSQCSATLEGSVYIQVMTNASGHQVRCKKQLLTGSINVFSMKKGKVTIQEPFRNRTEFFISNGTLKITNVEKNDSGQYNVEVFDPDGLLVKNININLDVEENTWHFWTMVGGGVALVVLIVAVIVCCVRWKKRCDKKSGSGKSKKQNTVSMSLDSPTENQQQAGLLI